MGFERDSVIFHVSTFPGDGVSGGGVATFVVEGIDALHAELTARGVAIDFEPIDQSWGNREMYLLDPDGNSIRFIEGND